MRQPEVSTGKQDGALPFRVYGGSLWWQEMQISGDLQRTRNVEKCVNIAMKIGVQWKQESHVHTHGFSFLPVY